MLRETQCKGFGTYRVIILTLLKKELNCKELNHINTIIDENNYLYSESYEYDLLSKGYLHLFFFDIVLIYATTYFRIITRYVIIYESKAFELLIYESRSV